MVRAHDLYPLASGRQFDPAPRYLAESHSKEWLSLFMLDYVITYVLYPLTFQA